jgi:lysophospholipase L1-like esterase
MLRKISVGALALAAGFFTMAAETSLAAMSANSPKIVYEGRHAADANGAVRLGFPGVTVHLRFRGAALTLRASASNEDCFFDVSVDGAAPAVLRLHAGEGDYSLVKNENAAEHVVVLTRRTESWMGTCALLSFDVGAGGELLAAPVLPARKLMFIGDSVTGGELAAWTPGGSFQAKVNSNARVAYGMILARRLGAQCAVVSYGGRGVIRDWQGIRDTRNAPQFYELALPDDPTARWDHRRYVPDAIGIGLGTNDFNQGIPDQNEFVNAYVEFVEKIRRDAPDAVIFLIDSPIVGDDAAKGPRRTVLHSYLERIVARVGSPKVMLAPIHVYPGVPGNGHPTGADHEGMANELEPVIRRALGW